MSFPQSSTLESLQKNQNIWRLFTDIVTSGDIYRSDIAGRAFAIGPQSDVGRVTLNYFDQLNSAQAGTLLISVDKPWVGQLDAFPSQNYNTTPRLPGNILISSEDLAPPPGFVPPLATVDDTIELIAPYIDVLFYLGETPSYFPQRVDRLHLFENLPGATLGNDLYVLVPFYNRKFAEVTIKNLDFGGAAAVTGNVYGINFSNIIEPGYGVGNFIGHQQELLGNTASIPADNTTDSVTIANRAFDYLAINIDPGGGNALAAGQVVLHIITSDKV